MTKLVSVFTLVALAMIHIAGADEKSPRELLHGAHRVLFLGDSITYSGKYVSYFDAWLEREDKAPPEIFNCGLPSETLSGLSEAGHAGGQFPRPDVTERLDRVLTLVKPDLVFACYGINCGIYQPFDEERFEKYQHGFEQLKKGVEAAGAQLIVITPPVYDDQRAPVRVGNKRFSYNGVLDRYSEWLVGQRAKGWTVIDLHSAMTVELKHRRDDDDAFTFQPDGVHPNDAGHWFIARQLLAALDEKRAADWQSPEAMLSDLHESPEAFSLIEQRMSLLRDAYLSAAGHKRPGVAPGLPLAEATAKQQEIRLKIAQLLR